MCKYMEDTSAPDFEIKKILQCLRTNGYRFGFVENSDQMEGNFIAVFKKDVEFTNKDGEPVNDSYIEIKIDFDARFDKNAVKDEYGHYYDYNESDAHLFIKKIMDGRHGRGNSKRRKTLFCMVTFCFVKQI